MCDKAVEFNHFFMTAAAVVNVKNTGGGHAK